MALDLRYALRLLARSPRFAVMAVVTLALGIGATTAIYAIVDAVLLKPLPYFEPSRVVSVRIESADGSYGVSAGVMAQVESLPQVAVAGYRIGSSHTLSGGEWPVLVRGEAVSRGFFDVFGVRPALGRTFGPGDESGPSVVLSDRLWRRAFGGQPGVVGQAIRLNGVPHTLLGVMPPAFKTPDGGEYWTLFTPRRGDVAQIGRGPFVAYARLRTPDLQQVRAQAASVDAALQRPGGDAQRLALVPVLEPLAEYYGSYFVTLLGAVGLVLLIACANAANLLLARAENRGAELSIRAAVGASRMRLVRQLLVEAVVLAAAASAAGLGVAWLLLQLAPAAGLPDIDRLDQAGIDWRTTAFALVVSGLTVVLSALVPAVAVSRRAGISSFAATPRVGRRSSQLLIAFECMLTLALLVGSALLLARLNRLLTVDVGFDLQHLQTATLDPGGPEHTGRGSSRFYARVLEEFRAVTGMEAVMLSRMPLDTALADPVEIRTGTAKPDRTVRMRAVSPGAFRVTGVPLASGREFTPADGPGAPRTAVVNETLAKRLAGEGSPLGMTVALRSDWGEEAVRVVGVVNDFRDHLVRATRPEIYVSLEQHPSHQATIVMRATRSPEEMTRALREAVGRVDPDEAVSEVTSAAALVSAQTTSARFVSALLTVFAAFALALAASGIVAVVAAAVARRTREIGIRVAVGAQPRHVIVLVMKDAVAAALVGGVAGFLLAYNQAHLLRRLGSSADRFDVILYALAVLIMLAIATVAALLPARAATRVDPILALRAE